MIVPAIIYLREKTKYDIDAYDDYNYVLKEFGSSQMFNKYFHNEIGDLYEKRNMLMFVP